MAKTVKGGLKRLIAMTLAVLLCIPAVAIPAFAETQSETQPTSEPSYHVAFYAQSDANSTVTFEITASSKPTKDTDVYYRVWSGDSQGAVTAQTGFVTFSPTDYTESGTTRRVTVQIGSFSEGLSLYSAPSDSVDGPPPTAR